MKKDLLLAIVVWLISLSALYSQSFWTPADRTAIAPQSITQHPVPATSKLFGLDLEGLKKVLALAPHRENLSGQAPLILRFPNASGKMERFSIFEAPTLHPDLTAQYPDIRSYAGQGIDDPSATLRFSVSHKGLHGMVLAATTSSYFIDPYTTDLQTYAVYARTDMARMSDFTCLTEQTDPSTSQRKAYSAARTNDRKLRKYRLAMSCTAEYGNIFAGTGTDQEKKANILAQINVTMTRVNGVYEKDLAITMEIVPNNLAIIYYGSTTADPWTNEYNTKTQQVIDAAIGNANYDIGHNFNTTGGGNAGCIGCVCTTGRKGRGYTGRRDPTGDAFDIDYVAHEIGHQFGGYHTMNTCSRSGSGSTEVEPASGSTIMSYAGICASNVQPNSDDYFAYVNIRDMATNVQGGISAACAQIIPIPNNPPTANAGPDYVIPKSTPFVLKGQGSDPDGDPLTYAWEQNDPARAPSNAAPLATWTTGPMFRFIKGTASPNRYMPALATVLAGNLSSTWEVLPSVGRTLNFALLVRDNRAIGGQTADDLMKVTVDGTSGPFVLSAPNTAVSWAVGSTQMVSWEVAGTSAAPVSCATVNILLSTDGGLTYPYILASQTANDGTETVTVPAAASLTCRIKVEAAENIFYDVSNTNFTITDPSLPPCIATVPTGLRVSSQENEATTIVWNAVPGAFYTVRYRKTGSVNWITRTVYTDSITIQDLPYPANVVGEFPFSAYQVSVRSNCPGGSSSAYSAVFSFTTTRAARVGRAAVVLEMYPNPVENRLQFNIPVSHLKNLKVYTLSGAELRNLPLQADGLDVSRLKAGMYVLSVDTETETVRKKFIKQ